MTNSQFDAKYAPSDDQLVSELLSRNVFDADLKEKIRGRAEKYVETIRQAPKGANLEDFMQEYSLTTKEGLSLMVLAEALLRVPDASTQNKLIEDKLSGGDWVNGDGDEGWLLMAASWGIGLSAKIVSPGETPSGVIKAMVKRLGQPVIRTGVRQAMGYLGHHFVLGQTIDEALSRAEKDERNGVRFSYDMLGEGARTYEDAERYYQAYDRAIERIGAKATISNNQLPDRPGISVKLSALHPRYFLKNKNDLMETLLPKVIALAVKAKHFNLNFTMDAEEADRLEISLDIFTAMAEHTALADWSGLGLAIQAYQKRAPEVVTYVRDLAVRLDRQFMVRLVKGAYWDTEVKRAQERGLESFPVFTRKAATDLCYLECARLLLDARPRLYPQFATHNALTMATLMELGGSEGFEFQRLHGMGEALYEREFHDEGVPVRVYAPVGPHTELLAYLVRRLLENAANSSFVSQVNDERVSNDDLLMHPQDELRPLMKAGDSPTHPLIRAPLKIYPGRKNSRGAEFGYRPDLSAFQNAIDEFEKPRESISAIINGVPQKGERVSFPIGNPADRTDDLGEWLQSTKEDVDHAFESASAAFDGWNRTSPTERAAFLRAYADVLEGHRDLFVGALVKEAGKTIDDALAEIREGIDFCRYYAGMAEEWMGARDMPSPVGETNQYCLEGRGVFVAVAPWNFPLAIFLGQITAAIAAGNTVVAKPAPQTPLTAFLAIRLMSEVNIPNGVCNLVLGGGEVGQMLIDHPTNAGVVFTGSTATAKKINLSLAERDGPIIPFIAETGGINAMIVDSTALAEQVTDAVVTSAFQSAGQRCSALRMLFLQDDIADDMIAMIIGATKARVLADPSEVNTDIGPLIDQDAMDRLLSHWKSISELGTVHYCGEQSEKGNFFAPRIVELPSADLLNAEAFGPILHIVRFKADEFDKVVSDIEKSGYGLTFGIHSRLDERTKAIAKRVNVGNVYINRNIVGAVVGVQPFGGRGLSGTGPKAGGPLYLTRFCEERTITEDTTAAGGNASLIAMSDE